MAGVTDVQRLQARLEELERWVYGPGGSRGSRKVADGLVKVQVALGNIASKRERVKILYKKIEDLIKYLDPEYMDRIAIPDASKLQFILAGSAGHDVHMHLGGDCGGRWAQKWSPCQSSHGYSPGKLLSGIWPGSGLKPEAVLWSSRRHWVCILGSHLQATVPPTVGATLVFCLRLASQIFLQNLPSFWSVTEDLLGKGGGREHYMDQHHSSRQGWILNPLSEARDQICIHMDASQPRFH
uniref:Dynactin subunit 3 n=1 Tax=Sus scrofa TaxID=9823 RepID=A0A8D0XD89_PIG